MSESCGVICRQSGCRVVAAFRYTWPGREESAVCAEHVGKLLDVARAICLGLQLVPISSEEHVAGRLASERR